MLTVKLYISRVVQFVPSMYQYLMSFFTFIRTTFRQEVLKSKYYCFLISMFPQLSHFCIYRELDCGNHECKEICHASSCRSCELQPDVVDFCPCGKMKIVELLDGKNRNSCMDPIPTCGNTCDGFLPCAKFNGRYTYVKDSCLIK